MAHFGAPFNLDDPWHNRVSPRELKESTLLMFFSLQGFDVQQMFICTDSCLFFIFFLSLPLAPEQQLLFDKIIVQYPVLFQ